jgi:hypothetical protein
LGSELQRIQPLRLGTPRPSISFDYSCDFLLKDVVVFQLGIRE